MSKIKTVISILAKIANVKNKDIDGKTELFFYHSTTAVDTPKTIFLNSIHTTNFLRKIEKKYDVYFADEFKEFKNPETVVEYLNKKQKEARAKRKEEKKKVKDFQYMKHGHAVFSITGEGITVSLIGNGAVTMEGEFWQNFDKWYSENRKKVLKKFKSAKVKKAKKPIKDDAPIAEAA